MKESYFSFIDTAKLRLLSAAFASTLLATASFAVVPQNNVAQPQNGSLDTSFAAAVGDGDATSLTSEVLPDGKILVGGTYQLVNGAEKSFLARLNTDGSLDQTFNQGQVGPNGQVYEIILLPDGKFLIGGFFGSYNGTAKSGVARLNADGTLDTTFNTGGIGVTGGVQGMVVQPDGRILISSAFTAYNGTPRFGVARLNNDGTLDASFTSPFMTNTFVEEVDVLPDGKVLIGGSFNHNGKIDVMRLNANGTVDTTFNLSGSGTGGGGVFAMQVQPDGKIVIGGGFSSYNGIPRFRGARLNPDGSLDATFFPPKAVGNGAEWIDILPDGKILIAGGLSDGVTTYALTRLNADGTIDDTFADLPADASGYHISRQSDGKIILTGLFNAISGQVRRNIVRLNADGTVDSTFTASMTNFGQVFDIALQADGKLVAAGNFRQANGVARYKIARFNADGTLDASFDPGTGIFADPVSASNFINTIAVQADGRILIGGTFGGFGGAFRRGIARLNANGSLDALFDAGIDDPDNEPVVNFNHILVLPDGKLLVGGTVVNSTVTRVLARLNTNGTEDLTFQSVLGNGNVQRIARQTDGKIVAVGNFNQFAGQTRTDIARVNPDGTLDSTFNPGTGSNVAITNLVAQADGKILIGGSFTTYNGTGRNRIARINADGSLDTTFNPGSGANLIVFSIVPTADGKTIIGGSFSTFNGVSANRLARINADGTLDTTFASGFNDDPRFFVRRMLAQPDGKLLISGTFKAYNGVPRNSLARLAATVAQTRTPFDFDGDGRADLSVFRPNDSIWYLLRSTQGATALPFGLSSDKLTPADFDGDGKTDVAVWRPSNGTWYWNRSSDGNTVVANFGLDGDVPLPGDYDGDGKADLAVFRQGLWYILNSSNGQVRIVQFGVASDKPVPADFDGDGKLDVSVYRDGFWYVNRSSDGVVAISQFGISTDKPVVADYDGDGKADQAVYRDGVWYLNRSTEGFYAVSFGLATDSPASADYTGDGRSDIAVFRDGVWYIMSVSTGAVTIQQFGIANDKPVPASYIF